MTARQAFSRGSELFEAGNFAAAAEMFRLAYDKKPSWKLLYNIGQCEAGARNYGLALEAFEKYIIEAGDDISEERIEEVQKEISRLRGMVGFVQIQGPAGTEIYINDTPRGILPLTGVIPLSAAREHVIAGTLNAEEIDTQKVKLLTGQTLTVSLENRLADGQNSSGTTLPAEREITPEIQPVTAVSAAERDVAAPAESPVKSRSAATREGKGGIAMMASGGVLLAAGFAVGGTMNIKARQLDDSNPDGVEGADLASRDRCQNLTLAGDIMMGIGFAVAVTGTILYLSNKRRSRDTMPLRREMTAPGVTFTGLCVKGSF